MLLATPGYTQYSVAFFLAFAFIVVLLAAVFLHVVCMYVCLHYVKPQFVVVHLPGKCFVFEVAIIKTKDQEETMFLECIQNIKNPLAKKRLFVEENIFKQPLTISFLIHTGRLLQNTLPMFMEIPKLNHCSMHLR